MATVFDIDFSGAANGDMNTSVPSGLKWSDAATGGFVFSEPAISGGAVVSTSLSRVALNRLLPGDDYGDVLDSWYVNFGYSAVPGNLTLQFTLDNESFASFGCVDVASDGGTPLFALSVNAGGTKLAQCKDTSASPATTISSAGLLVGGALNTAVISWDEYSVSFTLNGNWLHTITSSNRPRMHPFLRLSGSARVTRFGSADMQPEPPAGGLFWRSMTNATEQT